MRAFIAISLPDAILKRCQEISDRLRNLKLNARFSRSQSLHLTLKFLGNVEEGRIPGITDILKATSREFESFQVEIEGVGVFPNLARARIVWVGIRDPEVLTSLQAHLETQLQTLGFPGERRPFEPHLTLARLKGKKNLDDLAHYIQNEGVTEKVGVIRVEAIHLYQSILRPDGAEYRKLATAQLTTNH